MKLPTITLYVKSRNPNWVLDASLSYDERMNNYYITHVAQAEVLTIHLQKYSMRIRYKDACDQTQIDDVSAEPFFKKYYIEEK